MHPLALQPLLLLAALLTATCVALSAHAQQQPAELEIRIGYIGWTPDPGLLQPVLAFFAIGRHALTLD